MRLAEAYENWIKEMSGKRSASSVGDYHMAMRAFMRSLDQSPGDFDVEDISGADLDRYLTYLGQKSSISSTTAGQRYQRFQAFIDWLYTTNVIDSKPGGRIDPWEYNDISRQSKKQRLAQRNPEKVTVTPEEVEQLVEYAPEPRIRNALLIQLLWQTGVRRSEAASIRVGDVMEDESKIMIETSKREKYHVRPVFYKSSLTLPMKRWKVDREAMLNNHTPYLFTTNRDSTTDGTTGISPASVTRVVRDAADNAGIQETVGRDSEGNGIHRIAPHSIRRGFATHCVNEGMDLRTLQQLLGHSRLGVTERYVHPSDDALAVSARRYGPE